MKQRLLRLVFFSSVLMSIAGASSANDFTELTWEELIPESDESSLSQTQPNVPVPMHDSDDPWADEGPIEQAMATPLYPVGVVDELDGKKIKLPGFVVPLEIADKGKISEFLLVPYFGACIHYPPPPPNQIVYVKMQKPVEIESQWDPVWVIGDLSTQTKHSDLATASYSLSADSVEEYVY